MVQKSYVSTLDKREFLYDRVKVDLEDISFTSSNFNITADDDIWIYLTKEPSEASLDFPIIQSYVDVCTSGCFELEEEFNLEGFAQDFITMTDKWSSKWVNDRIFPSVPYIH